jgi:hypothetical protein
MTTMAAKVAIVAAVMLGCIWPAAAQPIRPAAKKDDNPHLWQPRVTTVTVFKNGLGFFVREGKVALRDGWCMARDIPPAAFGTLAIAAGDANNIVDTVGAGPGEVVEFDGVDAPDTLAERLKRLGALRELKVQLTYKHEGNDRTSAGAIKGVSDEYVVLQSDSQTYAVPTGAVTKLQVLELPIRVHVTGEQNKPPAEAHLAMAYLRKGITWVPEYTLKVLDDTTAELVLRGTLVNEAEDLVHCNVNLVVGVPHFAHTEFLAPIAVGQIMRTIAAASLNASNTFTAPNSQVMNQLTNGGALYNNRSNNDVQGNLTPPGGPAGGAGGNLDAALGNMPQLGGAAATDFTVYGVKDLTLRRGEKAVVTLFRKKITYGHIYRWTTGGDMEHYLVLHNNTGTAWTTGPCLALSDAGPLSEDLLKYTPKGAKGEFPITSAINVAKTSGETETDRKLNAHSPSPNVYFDLVTLEGTVTVRNYEKKAVTVVITAPIEGKPLTADGDGKISTFTDKLRLLERRGLVEWVITVEPNETKTLKYTYERYVPSN